MNSVKYKSEKDKKFDSIYQAYANDLYKVCLYFTEDKASAQEITEQTFIDFYSYFEEIDSDYVFAYLVRAARELFYDSRERRIYERGGEKEI